MRQLMRFLQKLPEEGPLSLMVDGKIIPCKTISITEDLVMVTATDDAVWYLDPDRIAGFSSDFLGEEMDLEEEILPSMHPHEMYPGRERGILPIPRLESPSSLREVLGILYKQRPMGMEELGSILDELKELDESDPSPKRRERGEMITAQMDACLARFPEYAQGIFILRGCLYGLLGEPRKGAALFLQGGRPREAICLMEHQEGYRDETEHRLLLGYYLLSAGDGHFEEESFAQRYAQVCTTDTEMAIFKVLSESWGGLGTPGEEALLLYLENKHPEKRISWDSDEQLLSYLDEQAVSQGEATLREECARAASALMGEAPQETGKESQNEEEGSRMAFYASTVKSRSYAGYQQAHLFFRKDAPLEGEERHYQEVYLNPRQVLDPLLGEILQKGTENDLLGLRIVFTPILNDKGVAGGDAFLMKEDRERIYAQVSKEAPRWCKHDTFIRYGARPYMGAAQMEEAFTQEACEAHLVTGEGYLTDWQVLRFLRMALCEDVEGAALPSVYLSLPQAKRCALALMMANSKEEKNLWISRLIYWLREEGEEAQSTLLEYFLFGLPASNVFHMDKEIPGKTSKEALWVKIQGLLGSLRLFQIPSVARQWRTAMLRDRRVKDASMLGGSHQKAWEKVSCLEQVVESFIKEETNPALVQKLLEYLSETEKEKMKPFLSLVEGRM